MTDKTSKQQILIAEHDEDNAANDGYMEVVIKAAGVANQPMIIDSVISLYEDVWGVIPDRIYRTTGSVPTDLDDGYVDNRELIWPQQNDPQGEADQLEEIHLGRDWQRELIWPEQNDPQDLTREQLLERISELENSEEKSIILGGVTLDMTSELENLKNKCADLATTNIELATAAAEATAAATTRLNRAITGLDEVHAYCDQLAEYMPKKARKKMRKKYGKFHWTDLRKLSEMMTNQEVHARDMEDPEYRAAYAKQEEEEMAEQLDIEAKRQSTDQPDFLDRMVEHHTAKSPDFLAQYKEAAIARYKEAAKQQPDAVVDACLQVVLAAHREWATGESGVQLNLRSQDLRYADLGYSNLNGADLEGATLIDANLFNANLTNADLTDVKGGTYREEFSKGRAESERYKLEQADQQEQDQDWDEYD